MKKNQEQLALVTCQAVDSNLLEKKLKGLDLFTLEEMEGITANDSLAILKELTTHQLEMVNHRCTFLCGIMWVYRQNLLVKPVAKPSNKSYCTIHKKRTKSSNKLRVRPGPDSQNQKV